MNLKDITLSEISQSQKDYVYDPTYMTYQELSNTYRQKVKWWMPETRGREERGLAV